MSQFGKIIVIVGVFLVVIGLLLSYGKNIPILNKLGHLPGDIIIKKENFTLYFPWVTCLVLSLIMYIILNLLRR
ncbi:MAG: DUF2905 domain-containing protein [Candidatus Marinimicrobia bacterium]|nr:DUF2905 domain-containing protein [Candidatus Neomarinimicrobiota bacterium]